MTVKRQGGNGKIHPLQAQGEIADTQAQQASHQPTTQQQQQQGGLEVFDADDGGISSQGKKTGGAEIHVAGIATDNVPGRGQDDVLQDDIGGKKVVAVMHHRCHGEAEEREEQRHDQEASIFHCYLPKRPDGLMARTSRSTPNDTARDQEGP